jgi:hypothetical protein
MWFFQSYKYCKCKYYSDIKINKAVRCNGILFYEKSGTDMLAKNSESLLGGGGGGGGGFSSSTLSANV